MICFRPISKEPKQPINYVAYCKGIDQVTNGNWRPPKRDSQEARYIKIYPTGIIGFYPFMRGVKPRCQNNQANGNKKEVISSGSIHLVKIARLTQLLE